MISTASQPSHQVLQNHPMMRAPTHSAPLLLSDDFMQLYAKPRTESAPADQPQTNTGSARRKLWELGSSAICPITSVCLHFHEVQKMARKVGLLEDTQSEYDQRSLVLQECCSRNALSEMVQREFDRRFVLAINRSQRIKTTTALAQWWDEACAGTGWAGEFWAVLTHPQCSTDLESIVLGQVHMLHGQMGIATRSEARRPERTLRRDVEPASQPTVKPVAGQSDAGGKVRQSIPTSNPVLDLQQRSVLCVGGRTQGIPVYREVIENRGARFTHHDGGEEEKAGRLERQLQAADLVICQVGCISHAAYWRVKAHCKRTGKPCLFVEMPSRSALERALGHTASQMENAVPLGQQFGNA
jgi:hypothetical protein